jgi:26S proteasome regulatory subunit N12
LETYFVQGSYQKILSQQQNVPLAAYNFFIEKFVDAIRYEIARSAECSYESIALNDMQKMFMIQDRNQLLNFIATNQKGSTGWVVRGERLHFVREKKEMAEIPNLKMVNLSLSYATELNRII